MKNRDNPASRNPTPSREFAELAELQRALAVALTQSKSKPQSDELSVHPTGQSDANKDECLNKIDYLQSIDPRELQRASETLVRKRISQTRHLLPLTTGALATSFPKLFCRFATVHHFDSNAAILLDAIYFVRWLSAQNGEPDWIIELARWESLRLSVLPSRFAIKLLGTRFDWVTWYASNRQAPPRRRRGLWIAIRAGTWTRVWRAL